MNVVLSGIASALAALAIILTSIVGQVGDLAVKAPQTTLAGVTVGNEYISTTTSPSITTGSVVLLKGGYGALGSIVQVVAGSSGGSLNFYDATTTNVNLRTGQRATSTILIASIPTDVAVGDYVYDAQFTQGLLMVVYGTRGTTTVTYR